MSSQHIAPGLLHGEDICFRVLLDNGSSVGLCGSLMPGGQRDEASVRRLFAHKPAMTVQEFLIQFEKSNWLSLDNSITTDPCKWRLLVHTHDKPSGMTVHKMLDPEFPILQVPDFFMNIRGQNRTIDVRSDTTAAYPFNLPSESGYATLEYLIRSAKSESTHQANTALRELENERNFQLQHPKHQNTRRLASDTLKYNEALEVQARVYAQYPESGPTTRSDCMTANPYIV